MTVDLTPADDRPQIPEPGTDTPPDPTGVDMPPLEDAAPPVPDVSEVQVRGILRLIGSGAHATFGHPAIEEHWRFTDPELDQLAPPVTSWINRNPRLRSAAQHGDAATIAVALGMYAARNVSISREVAAETEMLEDDTPAGGPAPDLGLQPFGDVP